MRTGVKAFSYAMVALLLSSAVFAQSKVHLTFLYKGDADEQTQWTTTCKAFSDSQNKIEVEYLPCANDAYAQKLLTLFASHDSPDTFYLQNEETPVLLKNNRVLDLMPFIKTDATFKLSDYVNLAQINKPFMKDGKVFAIHENDNPMGLWFNKSMLDSLGLPNPYDLYTKGQWTWDQFLKIAQKVKNSSSSAKPLYNLIQEAWFGPDFLWALSNGVSSFYSNGKAIYNDPKVVEALNWDVARIKDGTILYGASTGKGMDGFQLFQAGQVAFVCAGRWMTPTFKKITDFKYDVVPFPKGPQATAYTAFTPGYTAFAISAETKHPNEAWQWFKWYVGPVGQRQNWGKGGNCLPTIKGLEDTVLSDVQWYPHPQVWLDIQKVSIWPDVEYAMNPKANAMVTDAFQNVFMLQGQPKQIMDKLVSDLNSSAAN